MSEKKVEEFTITFTNEGEFYSWLKLTYEQGWDAAINKLPEQARGYGFDAWWDVVTKQ